MTTSLPGVVPSVLFTTMAGDNPGIPTSILALALGCLGRTPKSIAMHRQSLDGRWHVRQVGHVLRLPGDVAKPIYGLDDISPYGNRNGWMLVTDVTTDVSRHDGVLAPSTDDNLEPRTMLEQLLKCLHADAHPCALLNARLALVGYQTCVLAARTARARHASYSTPMKYALAPSATTFFIDCHYKTDIKRNGTSRRIF